MKRLLITILACLSLNAAHAQRSTLTEVNSVEATEAAMAMMKEVDEAHLLLGPQSAEYFESKTPTELGRIREENQQKIREVAVKFYEAHPEDPMRWEGILHMIMIVPDFITEFKEGYDTVGKSRRDFIVVDEKAKAAWIEELEGYKKAIATAEDVPWEIQEKSVALGFNLKFGKARRDGTLTDADYGLAGDELAKKFPNGGAALQFYLRQTNRS